MKENEPISITKVANGYIIEPVIPVNLKPLRDDVYIFENFKDMVAWVKRHFEPAGEDSP